MPRKKPVSFEVTAAESKLIKKIIDRVEKLWKENGHAPRAFSRVDREMDLVACHANGNPLDLNRLLQADDFNLLHDVLGIARHLDRETGKLLDFFSPRYSRREKPAKNKFAA